MFSDESKHLAIMINKLINSIKFKLVFERLLLN
jgi:hypothetical protein